MLEVKLTKSYTVHDKIFDVVTLREPTYKEVFMDGLGQPREWQPTRNEAPVLVVFPETVDAYLQRITVSPGYEFLSGLSALDALRLQKAVCDFFQEPRESTNSSTTSSSATDGEPQT
tara:strand:- start:17974 stop:18324 length:351 start_codon:yes stop_codon:yes gene_type:complete